MGDIIARAISFKNKKSISDIDNILNYRPKNYILNHGLREDIFNELYGWTVTNGTIEIETENYRKAPCLRVKSSSSGVKVTIQRYMMNTSDLKNGATNFWMKLVSGIAGDINYISLKIADLGGSNMWSVGLSAATTWTQYAYAESDYTPTGSPAITNIQKISIDIQLNTGKDLDILLDDFHIGYVCKPVVVLTFDDSYTSHYATVYPLLKAKGVKATMFPNPASVDSGGLSMAQLTEMYNNGWDVCNHTVDHSSLVGKTVDEVKSALNAKDSWLVTNGFTRNRDVYAHTNAAFDNNVLTALSEMNFIGARAGFQNGFSNFQFNEKVLQQHSVFVGQGSYSLASAQSSVDGAISKGRSLILTFHNIVTSPSATNDLSTADFTTLFNYIYAKKNTLTIMTYSDFLKKAPSFDLIY